MTMGWLSMIGIALIHVLYWVAVTIALVMIPLGLPGVWTLLVLALIFSFATGFDIIPWYDLVIFALIAGLGEVIETISGAVGAKRFGGTKWGMVAAILGGLAGAVFGTVLIPIPILGTVIGVFLFSFVATVAVEYHQAQDMRGAMRAGFGAFLGRVVSMVVKTSFGLVIVSMMVWRIYFGASPAEAPGGALPLAEAAESTGLAEVGEALAPEAREALDATSPTVAVQP